MAKNPSKKTTLQQFGKRSRSLRFGDFFSRFPNLRKSQPHFEVVVSPDQFGTVSGSENALIFGASLHDILERAPFTTKGRLCIPYVLHRCFSEISKKGIRSEGLFRLSGSAPKILQLESIFSQEPHFGKDIDLSAYDVHTLAGTFKKLLRSLPEPVIPHHLHIYYLNGYHKSASDEQNLSILSSLGHRMDAEHFDLLKYIIAVAAYVESEKESNKMTAEALAIVLAPTCTGLDGIINRLPATANRMSASLGRTSNGRNSSSNNVLQLSVVKDLEQWTSLFRFMINYHEELLQNWTGGNQSEEQAQESAESIQESASESELDAESEVLPSPVPSEEVKEEIPAPVSPLTTDFRSKAYDNIDIGSGILNASQGANGSAEYFTPTTKLADGEAQDNDSSENSEGEVESQENKEEQAQEHEGEGHFQHQTSSTFNAGPTPSTPKTPREELMALRSGRENMYNHLLRQWKSREESRSPRGLRNRSQTSSGAFSRSVLGTSTQVAPADVPAPQLVILCEKEADIKEQSKEEDVLTLTPNTESQKMKTVLTRQSIDSGVYSADGLSLSDLE
ncbi:Rho GTPase activation protein [Umbelopsis sp. AD052]|nr:Rho GTPase activation protein [Umbelopsis sp. AD052]